MTLKKLGLKELLLRKAAWFLRSLLLGILLFLASQHRDMPGVRGDQRITPQAGGPTIGLLLMLLVALIQASEPPQFNIKQKWLQSFWLIVRCLKKAHVFH